MYFLHDFWMVSFAFIITGIYIFNFYISFISIIILCILFYFFFVTTFLSPEIAVFMNRFCDTIQGS